MHWRWGPPQRDPTPMSRIGFPCPRLGMAAAYDTFTRIYMSSPRRGRRRQPKTRGPTGTPGLLFRGLDQFVDRFRLVERLADRESRTHAAIELTRFQQVVVTPLSRDWPSSSTRMRSASRTSRAGAR